MCDFATFQAIERHTTDKCQKAEMFTAFDITKAVRAEFGRGVSVPHGDVRQEVHNQFANGNMSGYTRSLANLPGVNPQPWIYHRVGDDASQYGSPAPLPLGQFVFPQAIPSPDGPSTDGGGDGDDAVNRTADGSYKVDGRGTLCLPNVLVRQVGLKPGDAAVVLSDPVAGNVVVSTGVPDATVYSLLGDYTVDKYGNVRITQHMLAKAGVGGSEYSIDGDAQKVVVKRLR